MIDDLAVYRGEYGGALTPEQIAAIRDGKGHLSGCLLGRWPAEEGSGSLLGDEFDVNDGTLHEVGWSVSHRPNDPCATPSETPEPQPSPSPSASADPMPTLSPPPGATPSPIPTLSPRPSAFSSPTPELPGECEPSLRSLLFDGNNDYVALSDDIDETPPFSITAWVYLDSYAPTATFPYYGGRTILARGNLRYSGEWDYIFNVNGRNRLGFVTHPYFSSAPHVEAEDEFPLGRWVFVAFTHDGRTGRLYQDGVLVGVSEALEPGDNHNTSPTWLGASWNSAPGNSHSWAGMIDDLAVYRGENGGALTPEQIAAIRDGKGHLSGCLLGRWPAEEGSGSLLGDEFGVNDGTLHGAAWSLSHRPNDPCATPPPSPGPPPSPSPSASASPIPPTTPSPTPAAPELLLGADPVSGAAPLTVDFEATVLFGGSIQYYRWDYNGDGVWDYISPRSPRSSHTYNAVGTYQAICEVEDSLARVARNSVYDILVYEETAPPVVEARADPVSGSAPLAVGLDGTVNSPHEILFYLWDFESDGTIDHLSLEGASIVHVYGQAGTWQARLSVLDDHGLVESDTVEIEVSPAGTPLTVAASADPESGTIPLVVAFTVVAEPEEDIVLYAWDFDGDGESDWSSQTSGSVAHSYALAGNYTATVRVEAADGREAADSVTVDAGTPAEMKIWVSSPRDGQTISGNAVTVRINTAPGNGTGWVQPQYRPEGESEWTDMTDPIYPPPYSFYCSWDTTAIPFGDYQIRGKGADTDGTVVYSDPVTVTVVAADSHIDETIDEFGNRRRREKTSDEASLLVEIAGGLSLHVPCAALGSADAAVILERPARNPHPGRALRALPERMILTAVVSLENSGGLRKPAELTVPYPDADDNGILDGTGIREGDLKIFRYNEISEIWQPTAGSTVYREENFICAPVMSVGTYAAGVVSVQGVGPGDYDGDGTAEIALYRPSRGLWLIRGKTRAFYGLSEDLPVPADYDGDGTWDIALFRPSSSKWLIRNGNSCFYGTGADFPVPADYDGDGDADIALFRPQSGKWAIRGGSAVYFGAAGDVPVRGDYDGDGDVDIAVFRPSSGKWLIRDAEACFYGESGDIPVPADYDGDGDADIALFRPQSGKWAVRDGSAVYFGVDGDLPVPADYDGDGVADIALFRSGSSRWMIRGGISVIFGMAADQPVTNP